MTPGRLRRCSAWLLPFLAARMLVPAGFMLSLSGGGLDIVLCTGLAPPPAAGAPQIGHQNHALLGHTAHSDSPAPPSTQGSGHPDHAGPICPFALAGGAVVAAAYKGVGEPQCLVALLPGRRADPAWISPAVLIDRIRGPPLV